VNLAEDGSLSPLSCLHFNQSGDVGSRVTTGQAHEVAVCRFGLNACSVCMFIQEAMKAKLYDQTVHPFGRRFCYA